MYKKQVFDIDYDFDCERTKLNTPVVEGYETQITPMGFRLRNVNKIGRIFNEFKPDIEIKYNLHTKKMTIVSNSLYKYFACLFVCWFVLITILLGMVILSVNGSLVLKFWFGVIIGMWFVIPCSVIVSCVIFKRKTDKIFDDIYLQSLNSTKIVKRGDDSMSCD